MTIVFFVRLFYPHIGGVEKHVLEISKRLSSIEHKIIVITEQYQKSLKEKEVIDGIEIYRIPVGKNERLKKFEVWWWLFKHQDLLKKADAVHAHDVFFWHLPFRFIYPRKNVFTTFHGYETQFPPSKKAILVRKISEKLSKGNICVGDYIKKWYGTKADYVTYGGAKIIQNSEFPPKARLARGGRIQNCNSKLKILFIGRLEEDIGIQIYLDALGKLKKKNKFEITFLGRGKYESQAVKYGMVVAPNHSNDMYHYSEALLDADIVFASSYLSMLAAMEVKRLVFAVYQNPLKEDYLKMAPFAKWIFIAGSPKQLAKMIDDMHKNPNKAELMVGKAYNWVKNQTWDEVVNLYLKLWRI